MELRNVLVSSAAAKIPLIEAARLAARRVSPHSRIIAGDADPEAPARHVADEFWAMPRLADMDPRILADECRERGISTIIPTRDGELRYWAEHSPLFEERGIATVVSPLPAILTCIDKISFAEFGGRRGLPIIPAALHPDDIDAESFVVKERFGAGSSGVALRVPRSGLEAAASALAEPIFQPHIEGLEISADGWLDREHRLKGMVLRTRDRVRNGESVITTTFRDDHVERVISQVLEALGLRGPVVLQALLSGDEVHIIECNARFGGASTAAIAAGLDIFFWTFSEITGVDPKDIPYERVQGEIRQIRVARDIHVARHNL